MGCASSYKKENEELRKEIVRLKEKLENNEKDCLNKVKTIETEYNKKRIDLSPEEIQKIMEENANLKEQNNQLELMLSMRNEELANSKKITNLSQFQNNMAQMQMNIFNNNNNFNNTFPNNQKIYSVIFKLENGNHYSVACLPKSPLGNIFLLLLNKIGDYQYFNIYNLQFFYMGRNITNHFINNAQIESLGFTSFNPIIEINKK